jgi:hypothetical protein
MHFGLAPKRLPLSRPAVTARIKTLGMDLRHGTRKTRQVAASGMGFIS